MSILTLLPVAACPDALHRRAAAAESESNAVALKKNLLKEQIRADDAVGRLKALEEARDQQVATLQREIRGLRDTFDRKLKEKVRFIPRGPSSPSCRATKALMVCR